MQLEILTLCEYAALSPDKLFLGGVTNVFRAKQEPAVLHFFVVFRIRFLPSEAGTHNFGFSIVNQDGKMIVPPFNHDVVVSFSEAGCTHQENVKMNGVQFDKFGEYSVELLVDREPLASQPLYFLPV